MLTRLLLGAAILVLAALAFWHPAPRPALETQAAASAFPGGGGAPHGRRHRTGRGSSPDPSEVIVYVAGAVRHPGLYHLQGGARAADAVAQAGGLTAAADAAGINLAARAADGDEIYAPALGEAPRPAQPRSANHRARRRRSAASPPPNADVNTSTAEELSAVPGIGATIAQRIVELRERDGAFASLDELLDVAGMTQTRLERARPFLHPP